MNHVKIEAEYVPTVNYALFHNRIPVCRHIDLTNESGQPLDDVCVTCQGEFIKPYQSALISRIDAGEKVRVSSFDVSPDPARLEALTEKVQSSFTLTVSSRGETIGERQFGLEFMPYDFWMGTTVLPQTVASFVMPNHPAVTSLIAGVGEAMKKLTGSSALSAYQTGNVNNVRMQVAAAFAAINKLGIVYRTVPASYETIGQRVTLPDQVVALKIGNCVELTLLMASLLEAMGINCLLIMQQCHAYLGVWLVDDCYPCSVCDDPAYIEKKCSRGIGEMLVLECTRLADEKASFEEAVGRAELNLAYHNVFEMFIDVRRCRLEGILPLPVRVQVDGEWRFDVEGVEHGRCRLDVKEHDRYDLSRMALSQKEPTKFDIWERKLLDFSLRNSLLNLYPRRRAVQFISFDIDRVEDHLQDGEEYCIMPRPDVEIDLEGSERLVRSSLHVQLHELVRTDIEHHLLHTYLPEEPTKDSLKNIYRSARSSIEETGANSLYLAIGILRWFETPLSDTPRYAPVLLLPVDMVYKRGRYFIRTREEDIFLNVTLMEFLRQNYSIRISGLDPLPRDGSGVNVSLIFAAIRDALKEQRRWNVQEECLLGIFSFSKFLMWNDIHSHREELCSNPIISSLVAGRLTWTPDPIEDDLTGIDAEVSPAETALPVAVDSSQMAAVVEAGKGHSFILYGPPGTGKSQTITNLVANALYHGKRVLFVAEKMAALSVVQSRLDKIGLAPFCLELHSNKTTKRHVLSQLEQALKVVHLKSPEGFAARADRIFEERKGLIAYMHALHDKDPGDGLSLFDCILRYESIDAAPMENFTYDPLLDSFLVREGVKGVEELLGPAFEAVVKLVGQPSTHPLCGLNLDKEMLLHKDESISTMREAAEQLQDAKSRSAGLSRTKELKEQVLRDNSEAIFAEDAVELRRKWREAKAKWFLARPFAKRRFLAILKKYNSLITEAEVEPLLDLLAEYATAHGFIERTRQIMKRYFDADIPEDELPQPDAIDSAIGKLRRWADHSDKMRDWFHWSEYSRRLKASGLACVVDIMQTGSSGAAQVREVCLKALFRHKAEEKTGKSEVLAMFEGMMFDEKVAAYRRMTEEFQNLTRKELYARLASRVPRMTDNPASSSEIGLLNRNISNGGRGLSLRDLFDQIPTLLPRLCPCMLMSPMSVAQYIDMGREKFDLVIFDEASQMPTSEAVGAIARGNGLVVVGDPKQMPPTSFFSSTNVDAEEAGIDDMESILEDCRTLEIPSLQLSWHYRSRHESLIAFSNNEYYDGSLITFPSVDDQCSKVHFVHVEGRYDKGGSRCNRLEAKVIVDEIERRLRDEKLRSKSIGVIAFSVMQQGLIEDMLQDRLDRDRTLQEAAQQLYEPVFVKNLENVQGDERDVILFSVGYGPDKNGKISMNFGPLNNAGGERRLNVAVSRARHEMYVYSALRSSDIDLRRSKARGVEGLKHFLEYAELGSLPSSSRVHAHPSDALLAGKIAAALQKRGYRVDTNVGRSQFKVDVAVGDGKNPGVYKLGILLDGEGYMQTHTTRDREVVQPSVLSGLDWQVMRVWSVDWFNNPQRVIDRIVERLEDEPGADPAPALAPADVPEEKQEAYHTNAREYVRCVIDTAKAAAMPEDDLMKEVIAVEQPIKFNLLCRRVCALQGLARVTPSLQRVLSFLEDRFYKDDGGALWLSEADSRGYEAYRPDSGREILEIPLVELENVAKEALAEQVAIDEASLRLVAARKIGFTRRGTNVDAALRDAIDSLRHKGLIESVGNNIRLIHPDS